MAEVTEVVLVAATAGEARYLPGRFPLVVTGPGKTAAAAATAAAVARYHDPKRLLVVNVGTAGSLHDGVSGIVVPERVLNHDFSAEAIRAMGVDAVDVVELDHDGRGVGVLATGDSFVESAAERERLAARAQLVDMEGFAVAYAARSAGARVLCVKHVSDDAGDTARTDWPAALDVSARALAAWVDAHL